MIAIPVTFSRVIELMVAIPQIKYISNQLIIDSQEYGWLSGSYNGDTQFFDFTAKGDGDCCEITGILGDPKQFDIFISYLKNPSIKFVARYIVMNREDAILDQEKFDSICASDALKTFIAIKQEECEAIGTEFIPIEETEILGKILIARNCLKCYDEYFTREEFKTIDIKKQYIKCILYTAIRLTEDGYEKHAVEKLDTINDGITRGFLQDEDLPDSYRKLFVQVLKNAIENLIRYGIKYSHEHQAYSKEKQISGDDWLFRRLLKLITVFLKNEYWRPYFIDEEYIPYYIPIRGGGIETDSTTKYHETDFYDFCDAILIGTAPTIRNIRNCKLTMAQKILEIKDIYEKNTIVLPTIYGGKRAKAYSSEFIKAITEIEQLQILEECNTILIAIEDTSVV
jgi:hypothetical protein